MPFSGITDSPVEQYNNDGYLVIEELFDSEEIHLLLETAKADRALPKHAQDVEDGEGGVSRLSLWFKPGDDSYGMFSRGRRVVDTMERLLGDKVCHYHSKMMLKEPLTGGAWAWHQDYGYWYNMGYPFADQMGSCLIAIDRATKDNGCLQVLRGSQRLGRLDHGLTGEQTGLDPEWIEEAMKLFDLVYCELEPGTALFFHSNLLHRSDQNRSPNSRWSLICCYTAEGNMPFKDHDHPGYEPLVKVPDPAIKELGMKPIGEDAHFMSKENLEEYNERLEAKRK